MKQPTRVLQQFWGVNLKLCPFVTCSAFCTQSVCESLVMIVLKLLCVLKCRCGFGQSPHDLGNGAICY